MIEFQNKIENVGTERNEVVWLRNLWKEGGLGPWMNGWPSIELDIWCFLKLIDDIFLISLF